MDKPWLQSYPPSAPHEIDVNAYDSVVDIYHEAISRFSDKPAFHNMGTTMSYGELDEKTAQFASWLQHEAGLKKGDRIAIMMPNLLQYPIAVFGALRAGLVVVNTNPLYTDRELEHQLKDSGAKAIVVVEAFAHTVADVIGKTNVETVITTRFGEMLSFPKSIIVNFVIKYVKKMVPPFSLPGSHSFSDVLAKGATLPAAEATITKEDLAFLQYTGGTTGVAKGAMLSHRNMVANILQAHAWVNTTDQVDGEEIIVTALPLYHIFALTANGLTYLKMGAMNLLITNPRDMPNFVKELQKFKFSAITGVNTLFNGLLKTEGFDKIDFSSLKLTLGGGMAVQKAVADRWKEVTGVPLVEAYGLTETSPAACINPMTIEGFNDSIGLPLPSTEGSIRDPDNNALPIGEAGELCIRGPQVMEGYWQRPEETAKTIDADGWLHTGDVAIMDEKGFFKIVDRLKDMVLVSGFNVYPNEIEGVIAMHPGVLEVGCIGIPDEHSGEAVKVVIVKKDPALTEADIMALCKEEMTGYKRPKVVQFVDELPKTNVGKILRRELREL
jgi:long-chain acyl-CoA synthetase